MSPQSEAAPLDPDATLVERARAGEAQAFELLMRRHNGRVYRAVRSILKDEDEAEEAMQATYLQAFTHLESFEARSRWSTWLLRIAMNEALQRARRKLNGPRFISTEDATSQESTAMEHKPQVDPEHHAATRELVQVLEGLLDALPEAFRVPLMLREVNGLSVADTADAIGITAELVKQRVHRGRSLLRERFESATGEHLKEVFAFEAPRCDRLASKVLDALGMTVPE